MRACGLGTGEIFADARRPPRLAFPAPACPLAKQGLPAPACILAREGQAATLESAAAEEADANVFIEVRSDMRKALAKETITSTTSLADGKNPILEEVMTTFAQQPPPAPPKLRRGSHQGKSVLSAATAREPPAATSQSGSVSAPMRLQTSRGSSQVQEEVKMQTPSCLPSTMSVASGSGNMVSETPTDVIVSNAALAGGVIPLGIRPRVAAPCRPSAPHTILRDGPTSWCEARKLHSDVLAVKESPSVVTSAVCSDEANPSAKSEVVLKGRPRAHKASDTELAQSELPNWMQAVPGWDVPDRTANSSTVVLKAAGSAPEPSSRRVSKEDSEIPHGTDSNSAPSSFMKGRASRRASKESLQEAVSVSAPASFRRRRALRRGTQEDMRLQDAIGAELLNDAVVQSVSAPIASRTGRASRRASKEPPEDAIPDAPAQVESVPAPAFFLPRLASRRGSKEEMGFAEVTGTEPPSGAVVQSSNLPVGGFDAPPEDFRHSFYGDLPVKQGKSEAGEVHRKNQNMDPMRPTSPNKGASVAKADQHSFMTAPPPLEGCAVHTVWRTRGAPSNPSRTVSTKQPRDCSNGE